MDDVFRPDSDSSPENQLMFIYIFRVLDASQVLKLGLSKLYLSAISWYCHSETYRKMYIIILYVRF